MRPSTTSQNVSAPAFDALTLVHADTNVRMVYGYVKLLAAVGVNAFIRAEVETGPGTDTYDVVFDEFNALGLLQETRRSFCFSVEGGRRYRFVKGGGVGVTEVLGTAGTYSYTDW